MKEGEWLVLDRVGRANQAVLARLSPLLEANLRGVREIVITECHNPHSSGPEIIRVHEDFKLFLLVDGESGGEQLNDAMRNKCVEIDLQRFVSAATCQGDVQGICENVVGFTRLPAVIRQLITALAVAVS